MGMTRLAVGLSCVLSVAAVGRARGEKVESFKIHDEPHTVVLPERWTMRADYDGAYFTNTTYSIIVRASAVTRVAPEHRVAAAQQRVKSDLDKIEVEIRGKRRMYRELKFEPRYTPRAFTFAGVPGALGVVAWGSFTDAGPNLEKWGVRTEAVIVAISETTLYTVTFSAVVDQDHEVFKIVSSIKPASVAPDAVKPVTPVTPAGIKPAQRVVPPPDGEWVDVNVSAIKQDFYDVWGSGRTMFVASSTGVYRSDDGGTTWTSSLPGKRIKRIWGNSKNDVYAVGVGSGIQRSRDGGKTWQELAAPLVAAVSTELGATAALLDVWSNGAHVYVVGERGLVLHSADQGATFTRLDIRSAASLEGVWGNKDGVFVVGSGGLIAISSDDGKTWRTATTPTRQSVWDVWGSGAHDIYAADDAGLLHGTADGAWTAIALPVKGGVTRIWGSSAKDFYCVVDAKSLLRTRDGGKTWVDTKFQSDPLIYGLWGPAPDDLFFVGSETVRHGK
ncbi:MAG: hypothetical protein H6Q90_2855 [Deltaproteobacteria bacterium]|nr:hypothetical protein [Deltaproteobacteria bacterium]